MQIMVSERQLAISPLRARAGTLEDLRALPRNGEQFVVAFFAVASGMLKMYQNRHIVWYQPKTGLLPLFWQHSRQFLRLWQ